MIGIPHRISSDSDFFPQNLDALEKWFDILMWNEDHSGRNCITHALPLMSPIRFLGCFLFHVLGVKLCVKTAHIMMSWCLLIAPRSETYPAKKRAFRSSGEISPSRRSGLFTPISMHSWQEKHRQEMNQCCGFWPFSHNSHLFRCDSLQSCVILKCCVHILYW